jgi:hemerythrin-like metal-binding protein
MITPRAESLLLSVPHMDREHLELIAQENEISIAVDAEASRAELEMLLTQLIDGFKSHFDSEERLMRSNRFPKLKVHTDEHRQLIARLNGLREDLASGVINRCCALVYFVRLWTQQHVTVADADFAKFLHARESRDRGTRVCFPS